MRSASATRAAGSGSGCGSRASRMRLRRVPAAVDVENGAVDEAGLVAGEVADGGCDLVRCGRAPGRGHGCEHVELAAHRFRALGAGRPWADRVDPAAAGT